MAIRNNNAKRLLAILEKIKSGKTNESTRDAIKRIFSESDDSRIGIRIGEIFLLANTVVKQLTSLPEHEAEVHLKWVPAVYQGLSTLSVNGNINEFKNAYTDAARAYLESVSVELGRHFPDPDIDSESLNHIYTEISPLIDMLLADETIDDTLKKFLIDKLTSIQDVISHAEFMGFSDLVSSAESAFAGTLFRVGDITKLDELRKKSVPFSNFLDWLGRVLVLFEAAEMGYKYLPPICGFLLGTGS